jgi:hypothetical protein
LDAQSNNVSSQNLDVNVALQNRRCNSQISEEG